MDLNFLEFEQPIAELEAKIKELRYIGEKNGDTDIESAVQTLQEKSDALTAKIYASLTDWQIVQVARHPRRPYTLDYIEALCEDFTELHGDRQFGDDAAIVGGLARFQSIPVVIIGHQKGRDTGEKIRRNFGMPRPEGYRKALRLMRLAERFQLPIVTFIDTPGAYPGIDAEARGQSEAIAANLYAMAGLKTPIVAVVIGEGGSGGALAIGVADTVLVLAYSVYAVISPEGCASILWKNADKAEDAARAMGVTAEKLFQHGLIDEIVPEPLGGAHRNTVQAANMLGDTVVKHLRTLSEKETDALIRARRAKIASFGRFDAK